MRLLYLNHNVIGRGTYQRASQLARAMVVRGHRVTLVTTSRDSRASLRYRDLAGVRVLEAPDLWWGPARTGWDPWNTLRRMLALRDGEFDAVHAFDCRPAVVIPAMAVRRRLRIPLFIDWADWWGRGGRIQERSGWLVRTTFGAVETWFEEAFRAEATGTTVISSALEDRARRLGIPPGTILRFPNGCDPIGITPGDSILARSQLGVNPDLPLFLHLGVLTPGEMALLAGAFTIVRQQLPRARLALVGEPRARVPASLSESGALLQPGYVDATHLELWLRAADLSVISMPDTLGNRGRWPGKINEYMSAGLAVVITSVGDAARVVREEGLGWSAPPDPQGLAATMLQAWRADDERREAGARARRLAEGRLSWARLAGAVEGFYDGLIRATLGRDPQ